ncbi:sensor histidine kinase [Niveispirillum irakense]|uniref:sensor histidine kinase n=1 Tax=Niveispirillum irakense TaxID=34011 RepID=UPI0004157253|nr:HWE histidine kinase domain-containing protein [Niveispirillum irakense]
MNSTRRLALAASAIALPMLVFAGTLVGVLDRDRERQAEAAVRTVAQDGLAAVEAELAAELATLQALASTPGLARSQPEPFIAYANRMLALRPGWCAVILFDSDGTVQAQAGREGQVQAPILPAPEQPRISSLFQPSECGDGPGIALDIAIGRQGQQLRAVVRPAVLAGGLEEIAAPTGWVVGLLDKDQQILARLPNPEKYIGRSISPSLATRLHEMATSGRQADFFYTASQATGENMAVAMLRGDRSGWWVIAAAPAATLEEPQLRFRLTMLAAGGISIAMVLVLALAFGHTTARRREAELALARLRGEKREEKRLTEVASNLPGIIYRRVRHPDGSVTYPYLSAAAAPLLGVSVQPGGLSGEDMEKLILPEERALWAAELDRSARLLLPYRVEARIRRPDGSIRWLRSGASARALGDGSIIWDGVAIDITDLKEAEGALRTQQHMLTVAMRSGRLMLWSVDLETDGVTCAPELANLFGLSHLEQPFPVHHIFDRIVPEEREAIQADYEAAAREGGDYQHEFRVLDTGDGPRWLAVSAQADTTPDGRPLRMVGVTRDITARKKAQARQELLMREVDHRAKNVLAVVQSLVRLTRADSQQAFVAAVEGRVSALARAHALLARNKWKGASLRALAEEALAPYLGADALDRTRLTGPSLDVGPDATQAVGMIFHELATNAAKYGALATPSGRVAVDWEIVAGDLHLIWRESGGPPVQPPAGRGFGSQMIDANVRMQLRGRLEMQWHTDGLLCHIVLPLAALTGTAPD